MQSAPSGPHPTLSETADGGQTCDHKADSERKKKKIFKPESHISKWLDGRPGNGIVKRPNKLAIHS